MEIDAHLRTAISKLIVNASSRSGKVSELAETALNKFAEEAPLAVVNVISSIFKTSKTTLPESFISICMTLFTSVFPKIELSKSKELFLILEEWFSSARNRTMMKKWDEVCSKYITSEEVARECLTIPLHSTAAVIIQIYCSRFLADEVITQLGNFNPGTHQCDSQIMVAFVGSIAQNSSTYSAFFGTCFQWVFHTFLENPSRSSVDALNSLLAKMPPKDYPATTKQLVARMCDLLYSLPAEIITESLKFLTSLACDAEMVKRTAEVILTVLQNVYAENSPHAEKGCAFPVEATEMPPSCPSTVYATAMASLVTLCKNWKEIVLAIILSSFDSFQKPVVYSACSHILNHITFSEEQKMMIVFSATGATSHQIFEPSLCQLVLQVVQRVPMSEHELASLVTYVADAAMQMRNAHYFLQIVSFEEKYVSTIFDMLCDFMFDEKKLSLLPSLSQTMNLLIIRMAGDNKSFYVHESPDESENYVQHPLVPVLMKRSITEKSLYLLRVLSCLMSIGALHPFVPSMLSNLAVFFEFAFPMAFTDIKVLLDSVSRCINSSSEFPSLIMSLLANIMKLLNDRQFRISLCGAVIHEVEHNHYAKHTHNCVKILGIMIPFLPADVASGNIDKLFTVLPHDVPELQSALANLIGMVSSSNGKLIMPLINTWLLMKSNASFVVGKNKMPISYSFICSALSAVAREIPIDELIQYTNSHFLALVLNLIKKKEAQPSLIMNAMSEICRRLSFQRIQDSSFCLKQVDIFLKYVVQQFVTSTNKTMHRQCLLSLRLLIQVPPCITRNQFVFLMEKIVTTEYLLFALTDASLFAELRGLLLAIVCALPETEVVSHLMKVFIPCIDNQDVLSCTWRVLSMFSSHMRNDPGSIKFFRAPVCTTISAMPKFLVDLLAASYKDTSESQHALQSASLLVQISKNAKLEHANAHDVLKSLSTEEFTMLTSFAIASAKRCKQSLFENYTFLLSECWKINEKCLKGQTDIICADIFNEKVHTSPELLQQIVLKMPETFFEMLIATNLSQSVLSIVEKTFTELECVEHLLQQLCLALLLIPDDNETVEKLLRFCDFLLSKELEIPKVHIFQMICSMMIFGLASREFASITSLFTSEFKSLKGVELLEEIKPTQQRNLFICVWKLALKYLVSENLDDFTGVVSDVEKTIAILMNNDKSLLIDVMNFVMSTSQLTKPVIASAVSLFSGEVVNALTTFSVDSHIFNLFYSALLSFGPLFDNFTCICCLNQITKLMRRECVGPDSFPHQFTSRTLQVIFKRSSSDDPEVIDAVTICLYQYCVTFRDGLVDKLHEFIFGSLVELVRHNRFSTEVTVVDVLESILKSENLGGFQKKYALVYKMLSYHVPERVRNANEVDVGEEETDVYIVVNMFIESGIPWMICSAIDFLSNTARSLLPSFATNIVDCLDSDHDEVARAAETAVVHLI